MVAREQIISDKLLKSIQSLGDPKAHKGSTEEIYGTHWFGESWFTVCHAHELDAAICSRFILGGKNSQIISIG